MRRRAVVAAVVAACAALGVVPGSASGPASKAAQAGPLPSVAALTSRFAADGAWCWFSEPRAVRVGGTTYAGWITSRGDIEVAAYSHADRTVRTRVLMAAQVVDDHAAPSLLARPDGRITVFWSAHNGADVFFRTSQRAGSVAEWGPLQRLPSRVGTDRVSTYTNPVLLRDEQRLYLFFRSGYLRQGFTTSPDLGRTWTRPRVVVEQPGERPYVKYASDGRRTIALAFTDGHPAEARTSVYAATYHAGYLRRADGTPLARLGVPLRPAAADLVYRARGDERAWVHDVALDAAGRMRIVFAVARGREAHEYWYAAFDGRRWTARRMVAAGGSISDDFREPYYSPGIALDHSDPSSVVLSRDVSGRREVEQWRTPDAGRTWSTVPLTSLSLEDNVRPVVPRGPASPGAPEAVWMAGRYGYFTGFRTAVRGDRPVVPSAPVPTHLDVRAQQLPGSRRVALVGGVGPVAPGARVAGLEVTVLSRPAGWRSWTWVGTTTTTSAGIRYDVRPRGRTEYRLLWPGDTRWARSDALVAVDG